MVSVKSTVFAAAATAFTLWASPAAAGVVASCTSHPLDVNTTVTTQGTYAIKDACDASGGVCQDFSSGYCQSTGDFWGYSVLVRDCTETQFSAACHSDLTDVLDTCISEGHHTGGVATEGASCTFVLQYVSEAAV